jgi:siroheme synthase-like protein
MTSSPKNSLAVIAKGNQLFPIFLKLNQLHTVLIGGGFIGLEKLTAIVGNSQLAKVTVIARTFLPELKILALENDSVNLIEKSFEATDLDNAQLVIAATNDNELNEIIVEAAHKRNLLVNIADKPALCDFYLGSIVQKGDLKLAISTNGKSPTVAKRLKEVLNESIPDEIDITLQQVAELRKSLTGDFANKVKKLNELTATLIEKNSSNEALQIEKFAGEIS